MAQGNLSVADQKFDEAARLSNGTDFLVQFHRARSPGPGTTASWRGSVSTTRCRSTPRPPLHPMRDAVRPAWRRSTRPRGCRRKTRPGHHGPRARAPSGERRLALLSSAIGTTLPALATTNVAGAPACSAERGNVTLLNFFAAW